MPRTSAPRKRVDRLVRVADDDQVAAVAGERPEQGDLAGVGVLVLVDEDVAEPRPQLVAVGLGLDHRAADQVGVVDGALVVEDVEVLRRGTGPAATQLGQPVASRPSARSVGAVEPLLAGPGQHGVHLAGEAAGADAPGAARRASATDSGSSVSSSRSTTSCSGARQQPQRRA